jgi:8-oxo-dGTP diphosphatase
MRGSVAAGKSTFAKAFFKRHSFEERSFNGIISTDSIKRRLIREAVLDYGIEAPGYLFHDEASMVSARILAQARKEGLLYFIDKRMQHEEDLEEVTKDASERNLSVTIFDLKTDFMTSALRVLSRSGRYPSDPTPDFEGLFKSFKAIEESASSFLEKSLASSVVKNYYSVRMTRPDEPSVIPLKDNFAILEDNLATLPPPKKIKRESFENVLLSSGQTLDRALDEHSKYGYGEDTIEKKDAYFAAFLKNIEDTSRTYNGDLDTSASPDKKAKLNTEFSPTQVSNLAIENLKDAFEFVYSNKNLMVYDAAILKQFISEVAWRSNKGFIRDKASLLRVGDNSHKYDYVDTTDVAGFYDAFVQELLSRIKDIDIDPVETAAWIEWNMDFSGHLFSDGCGRVAKLISSWLLMRRDLRLPDYKKDAFGFATVRESYRKRFAIREKVSYKIPTNDVNYRKFSRYYKSLFQEAKKYEQILAAGGLIYNTAGQFLITQSTKGKDAGKWVVPGGKLEKDEEPEEAFERESFEETGLHLGAVSLLGIREYTAASGNPYKFYDYTSILSDDKQAVVINNESSAYEWIYESEIKDYKFADSIHNFLSKYFTVDMLDYYDEVEHIDTDSLDVPEPDEHTMSHSLRSYIDTKLPMEELRPYLLRVKAVEVHDIYPDVEMISKLKLDFRTLEVIHKSKQKSDNSNSLRPIFLLAEKGNEEILVCCTTPGRDLLLHYASMLKFVTGDTIPLSVYAYPIAEETIDKWTGLDQSMVSPKDIVILGYSTHFKNILRHESDFTLLTIQQNKFYTSTRFIGEVGIVINCLEANYGHWGNISDYLARRICQLGASEILHIGKVGTFTSPSEIYKRIYIPSSFLVGRRNEVIHSQARIRNSMDYIKEHLSLGHVSVSTTMEETFGQREVFNRRKVETIDIESSKIAQAIASYNLTADEKVKFGAIHFASDYLRKTSEIKDDFEFDLSTKRVAKLHGKKDRMLIEIFEVIKRHMSRSNFPQHSV